MTSPFQVGFRFASATLKGENLSPKVVKIHEDLCLRKYRTCDNSTWFLELISRPLCACLDSSVECGSRICAVSKYLLAPAARDNFQIFSRGEIIDDVRSMVVLAFLVSQARRSWSGMMLLLCISSWFVLSVRVSSLRRHQRRHIRLFSQIT